MTDQPLTRRTFLLAAAASVAAGQRGPAATGPADRAIARPRLYFTAADLPNLRQRIEADPLLRAARADLLRRAEAALKLELMTEDHAAGGAGQHGNYYAADAQASAAIETCGFAYVLTGEPRFADRARLALRHFAHYQSWTGRDFARRDPPWHSALETAHFTRAYALGIDWLGDALAPADRKLACDALFRLGVEPLVRDWLDPARRIHALDSMGHNWWMVCIGAAALGLLTLLGEHDRAEPWLTLAVDAVNEFFRYPGNILQNKPRSFDPAGGFYESLGYADYTLRYYAYLAAALRQMFPQGLAGRRFDKLPPELDGIAEFMLHFTYPRQSENGQNDFFTAGFGDDGRHTAFSGDVTLFLARATGNGRYRWYFDHYSAGPRGFYQILFYDPAALPRPTPPDDLPLSRALHTIGWAALRDSWKPNATFLAVKCGDTWNHAHADAASFVLFAAGEPLLIDPGACSYGRREYRSYYTESIAHNVVLVDGQGQPPSDGQRGVKFPGRLHSFLDVPDARYLLADATGPYAHLCGRFLRHFLWLDDAIFLIDDLLAHKPGRFEWLFHGETPPQYKDGRMTVASGAARLEMDVLFPNDLEPQHRKGLAIKDPDRTLDYLALRQRHASRDAKFFAVLRAGRELPAAQVASRQGTDWLAAQITTPTRQWDVYCNLRADGRRMHVNSNNRLDLWHTDAFLLAVRSGAPRRIVLIGASYLRDDRGESWLDSFSKCNAVLTCRPTSDRDIADARVQAPPGTHVRLRGYSD